MKTSDLIKILKECGYELTRRSGHDVWSNGYHNIVLSHDKNVNRMMARRFLKEIKYANSVPQVNYYGHKEIEA